MSTVDKPYKPDHKDLPILDQYLKAVLSCQKNPAKQVSETLKEVSLEKIYATVHKNKIYIEQKVKEYLKEADVDKLRVLAEIKNIAYSNIGDYGNFNGTTMTFEKWTNLDRADLACIKDIKITTDKFGEKNVHFTLHDKQRALQDLVKILELSHDIVEHKGHVTYEKRLFDE